MPKVDIKLYSTDSGTGAKQTTTVSYVNPDVSNSVLQNFGQMLNGLTDNNYGSTDRVETTNTDTEGSRKISRNLTISNVISNQTATITFNIEPNEETRPSVFYYADGTTQGLSVTAGTGSTTQAVYTTTIPTVPQGGAVVYVGLAETTEFNSAFLRTVITA